MRISEEKYNKLKNRGKRVAAAAAGGAKGSAVETGVGGIASYADVKLKSSFPTVAKNWWASGGVVAVIGHFVKKKKSLANVGAALCGAGGVLLGQGFQNRKKPAATTTTTTTPTAPAALAAPAAPAAPETKGFDTGFVTRELAREQSTDTGFVVRSAARDF